MQNEFPEGPPGIHPPTAGLARMFRYKNILNPITGKPFSEAFLLGVGGGLDAAYILFQFKHLPHPILVLGFRNQWNQTEFFLENLTSRLNMVVQFNTFDDDRSAEKALQETIKKGNPPIVWVDKACLPYHQFPSTMQGLTNHQVVVYGRDAKLWRLYLDDMSSQPLEIREKAFTKARANLSQNNYLSMVLDRADSLHERDLQKAIIEGVQECTVRLTRPIKTIGISNLTNWAEKMIDHHNRQGWPQVFRDRKGLFPALIAIYESIKLNGTGGFALRKLYSDFLQEAAEIINNPALNAVAGQYLQLSNHWSGLADNALPSKIPVFDRAKNLLNKKYKVYREGDLKSYHDTTKDLDELKAKIAPGFPLDNEQVNQLFTRLSGQVKLIAELEMSAALRLRDLSRRW